MTLKVPAISFGVIACTSDTLFPDSFSRKSCIIFLFFSVGTVTNPAILLVINAVQIFLSLPTGAVSLARAADYIPNFVATLHNYISFSGWAMFLGKQF